MFKTDGDDTIGKNNVVMDSNSFLQNENVST